MYRELRATNFKSWKHTGKHALQSGDSVVEVAPEDRGGIPLAGVTGFFGTNSSGKTSLLQILLLLKQTVESLDPTLPLNLGDERSLVQLGTFDDVLHRHQQNEQLSLGVSWDRREPLTFSDPTTQKNDLFKAQDFSFDASLFLRRSQIEVQRFRYLADANQVTMERQGSAKPEYALKAVVNGDRGYLKRVTGRKWPLPRPVKSYGFPDQVSAYFQNAGFVRDLELEFEQQLGRTYYLGPLRESPKRDYTWTGARPRDVGYDGAGAVPALLAARLSGERQNFRSYTASGKRKRLISVEQHVAEWLTELGLVHSFRVRPLAEGANIYRVHVQRTEESAEVLLTDVGFGVSQILPVLVLLAYVPEGSTVLLEQPEIHLHPAVQAGLADVILETAIVRNVQVLVESHSEHLLRRIQMRVAEGSLESGTSVSADAVKLSFVDQDSGNSRALNLELNVFGEVVNWPENFFGKPFEETARIARAARSRKAKLANPA